MRGMSVNRFPIITKGALMVMLGSTLLMTVPNAEAQDLGKISTCPSAPQISAAATAFALSNDSGLKARQASVLITTVMRQITQSAPYLASESTLAAMKSLQLAVLASSAKGEVARNDLAPEKVSTLSIEQAITTSDGYRKMTKAVVQGGIDGAMSMGLGAEGLQKLITAVTVSLVADASVQSANSAVNNPNKDPSKALPMDTPEEGSALTKVIVSTIVQAALKAGFTDQEISTAINKAGNVCVETAKNLENAILKPGAGSGTDQAMDSVAGQVASQVAAQVASQVAAQVAAQVASQVAAQVAKEVAVAVASAVAAEVKNHVDTKIQLGAQDPEAVTDPLSTPGVGTKDTLPTAPGQAIIPGVNVPPQNLAPLPTPTPASPGGPK